MNRILATSLLALLVLAAPAAGQGRDATTQRISNALGGGVPDGPSANPVISNDRRYARVIAFESEATNLVNGDTNGQKDVFAVTRAGSFGNDGSPWDVGGTELISKAAGGGPANGPSYLPAVNGSFQNQKPTCVAFVSEATNLVSGDRNGQADAFLSKGPGNSTQKISEDGGVTQVAVSGDCSRIAYVEGGRVKVKAGSRTRDLGRGSDPSFATGQTQDLVFAGSGGVRLSKDGTGSPRLIAPGGTHPGYNDVKCEVVTYQRGGSVFFRKIGGLPRCAVRNGTNQIGPGSDPVIGNSGFYVAYERDDRVYVYSDTRPNELLLRSQDDNDQPIPGAEPSMSFYQNYIVFESAGQILMRYLGPV